MSKHDTRDRLDTRRAHDPLEPDAETRALVQNPVFNALIEEARASKAQGGISPEELARDLGITDRDRAIAREYLDAFDRLEAEQDAEVTEEQSRALHLVLTAARYLRGEGTLAELAEDTGIAEPELRAAAVALQAVGAGGLPATRPGETATVTAPAPVHR